jgi:hypothetical protein
VSTGGAGTGKTTLAMQLLLELLANAEPAEPVPVLFSLASWDIHTDTGAGTGNVLGCRNGWPLNWTRPIPRCARFRPMRRVNGSRKLTPWRNVGSRQRDRGRGDQAMPAQQRG